MKKIIKLFAALLMCLSIVAPVTKEVKAEEKQYIEFGKEYDFTNIEKDEDLMYRRLYFDITEPTEITIYAKGSFDDKDDVLSLDLESDLFNEYASASWSYYDDLIEDWVTSEETAILKPGLYYINSYWDNVRNIKYLRVDAKPVSANVNSLNKSFSNAYPIELGKEYRDFITTGTNNQVYLLTIDTDGIYDILMRGCSSYELYDSNKNKIEIDYKLPQHLAKGNYYIVTSYCYDVYTLSVNNTTELQLNKEYTDLSFDDNSQYYFSVKEDGYYDIVSDFGGHYYRNYWPYSENGEAIKSVTYDMNVYDDGYIFENDNSLPFDLKKGNYYVVNNYDDISAKNFKVTKHENHVYKAIIYDYSKDEYVDYRYDVVEPTCSKDGSYKADCIVCGYTKTFVESKDYHYADWEWDVNYVAPTANSEGYSGDVVCKTCGEVIEKGYVLPKKTAGSWITNTSSTSIKVSWDKVDGAAGYYVYRATSKTGKYTKVATITKGTTTTYTNKKLKTGKTYFYKVSAYNSAKKVISTSTISAATTLAKPSKVKVTSVSPTSVKVSCAKVAGAKVYAVYASTSKTGNYEYVGSNTTNAVVVKNLQVGKTYYFKVIVGNDYSASAFSAAVAGKPVVGKTTVSLTAKSKGMGVKWKAVAEASGYEVYRSTAKSKGYVKVADVTTLTFADSGLKGAKTYYYKVRAYYIKADGTKVYGTYSSPVAKKTKK